MTPARLRQLALVSYSGTLVSIVLWYFVFSPPRFVFSTVLSLIYCGILLLPAYGLVRNRPRVYLWSSYLILIYFMHAIVETYANHQYRGFAIAELVFSLVYFFSASVCARYQQRKLL